MKNIVIIAIMLASLSLDASGKVSIFSRKVALAFRQENRIYQDIMQTTFCVHKKRSEIAVLEGVVAQYADKKDLEEHEFVRKFNARGKALCLRSEIDHELDVLRWVKMQNLGLAFAQTKAVLKSEIGLVTAAEYDQLKVPLYSELAKILESRLATQYALTLKKAAQKDLLLINSEDTKELK